MEAIRIRLLFRLNGDMHSLSLIAGGTFCLDNNENFSDYKICCNIIVLHFISEVRLGGINDVDKSKSQQW